ncbi:MAG: bifunctional phosphoribosylaminoimidazolecarboxamide formyltransferase/IMP cyclohydrolase [Candidatus Hydrothermales bacterium]
MKKALISVYDKSKLEIISKFLIEKNFEIYATSGTKKYLEEKGLTVKGLDDLGIETEGLAQGRIKTLHPLILQKILDKEEEVFEVVIVNFYPFYEKLKEAKSEEEIFEFIDIGGVNLVRAACKNIQRVIPIVDPSDYEIFIEKYEKGITLNDRFIFASKAFEYITFYDVTISEFFRRKAGNIIPDYLTLAGKKVYELRYGENPQQFGVVFGREFIEPLQGKKLSYNNLLDVETAFLCVSEFEEPTCVIVKHASPCGVACGESPDEAFERAYLSDPESSFGGVLAFNTPVDKATCERILSGFFEIVVAPSFEEGVLDMFKGKKNLRVIDSSKLYVPDYEIKSVFSYILYQNRMKGTAPPSRWELKTKKKASSSELEDLFFALKVVKYAKSNAICIAKAKRTLGIGSGQPSRIRALEIAVSKAKSFGLSTVGAVLASDGFFPFRDSIDKAYEEGIVAVVSPCGSIRDEEVVRAAEENGIALYFIKERYFRH